jgi:DNA mismatch endonuclease (patch repair protein)
MDSLSPEQRSRLMARIRSKNTAPEQAVRGGLRRSSLRFRGHESSLPGTPDFVLPESRVALFVHGCFWHQHGGCASAYTPKTRRAFWKAKFDANRRRDRRTRAALTRLGWRVGVLWECQLQNPRSVDQALARKLRRLDPDAFVKV